MAKLPPSVRKALPKSESQVAKKALVKPKPTTARQSGRPSKYTPQMLAAICARLETGEPLAPILRTDGMPSVSTLWEWQKKNAEVSERIARAREIGFDAIAAETLRIADECRVGEMVETGKDGEIVKRRTGDMVERARLQVDTRLRLLAKWDPKRYGDKVAVEHSGQVGLVEAIRAARERAKRA